MGESAAYEAGRHAYRDGLEFDACPMGDTLPDAAEWKDGWLHEEALSNNADCPHCSEPDEEEE